MDVTIISKGCIVICNHYGKFISDLRSRENVKSINQQVSLSSLNRVRDRFGRDTVPHAV